MLYRIVPIALAASLIAIPAGAVDNLRIGTIQIHPYLQTEERYDDNIYLVPSDQHPMGSWINIITPGLYMESSSHPRYKAHLDLKAEFLRYSRDSDQNNAFHRFALADIEFKFPRSASLQLFNNYAKTSDPATSELTARLKRTQNDAGLVYERGLIGRVGAIVDGQYTLHRYDDDTVKPVVDRDEYHGGGGLFYRLAPKTDLIARYHYTHINYKDSANTGDSQTQVVDAGLRGQLSPKIKALMVGGVQWRRYDQSAGNPPPQTTGSYGLQLDWTATERLAVQLLGNRTYQESIFAADRYYVSDAFKLGVTHKLGEKWILDESGGFEHATYPTATAQAGLLDNRVDNRLHVMMHLSYIIQPWLTLGCEVAHFRQSSNFPIGYSDTRTGLIAELRL